MDDYKKLIADVMAAAGRGDAAGPQVFENFGPGHARAVVEAMIRVAKNTICVYSKRLSADVYDAELLATFASRHPQGTIKLLVEDSDVFADPESALYGMSNLVSDKFEVRVVQNHGQHLAVVDGQYARLEQSQETRKAIVSFGNNSLCESAQEFFDLFWSFAAPIVTPLTPQGEASEH
jgi:hypothetical protein